jgi:hypothetical protein
MYRSTAKRAKRTGIWALTAALSVGAGLGAANLATMGSHLTAASATATTATTATTAPAASTPVTVPASSASVASTSATSAPVVHTAALTTSPTPRTVVSVTAKSITVRSSSGAVATYGLNAATIYLSGTTHVTVASVHPGGQVIVVPSASNAAFAGVVGILPSRGEHESESNQGGFDN